MTTTAYDTHFIASDIAFTDNLGNVSLDIPFRKVKRIGPIVLGMAGCLRSMVEFTDMAIDFVLQKIPEFEMPLSILNSQDRDFMVLAYTSGTCLKIGKLKGQSLTVENITQIPTVIGSGSDYVGGLLEVCPNALVAVLEAIKHDQYTDGEVKYCSILREDIHNLEVRPVSTQLQSQIAGLLNESQATTEFLRRSENEGLAFQASTKSHHTRQPDLIAPETGMLLLKQAFAEVRDKLATGKADSLS